MSASTVTPRQRPRDVLLGWAAGTLAGSAAVLAIADILGLVDSFETNQHLGFRIAAACKLVLDVALIPAFALSCVAFLAHVKKRSRRLELGATIAAAGATIGLIGGAVATAVSITHQFPRAYIAVLGAVVVARFTSVFAALAASSAFSASTDVLSQRDRKLAWASIGLASSYVLAMVSQLFLISYSSHHGASNGTATAISIAASGAGIAAGAGVISAVALYRSQQQQRRDLLDWLPRRDALLGLATAVFAVAFLLSGLGAILQATAEGQLNTRDIVLLVLTGVAFLGNAIAGVCAAVGFSRSRLGTPRG